MNILITDLSVVLLGHASFKDETSWNLIFVFAA